MAGMEKFYGNEAYKFHQGGLVETFEISVGNIAMPTEIVAQEEIVTPDMVKTYVPEGSALYPDFEEGELNG